MTSVWQPNRTAVSQIYLRGFDDLTTLYAAGADLLTGVAAGGQFDSHPLEIRVKPPSRFIVCV